MCGDDGAGIPRAQIQLPDGNLAPLRRCPSRPTRTINLTWSSIMAGQLDGKRILILATNGFEQSELEVPRDKLKAAGARVDVVSPESGEIKGWDMKDWGRPVKVDKKLSDAKVDDYDAIVLPGGQI